MKKDTVKKQVYEKILNLFAWLTLALALITAVLTIFSSFSDDKNGKEIFGHKFLIVASDSMSKSIESENEPVFFNAGDIVIIKTSYDVKSLKAGDVISFFSYSEESYGKTLTHKIRDVKNSAQGVLIGYETYGINTGVSDSTLVTPEAIMGQYVGKIWGLGNVFSFLQTPQGYYLSVLTPLILLIIFFSIKIGKHFGIKEGEIARNAQGIEQNAHGVEHNAHGVEHNAGLIEDLQKRLLALEKKLAVLSVQGTPNVPQVDTSIPKEEVQEELESVKEGLLIYTKSTRLSFAQRILNAEEFKQNYFDKLHNEICKYKKVHYRFSFKSASYRIGRNLLAKINVRGKTLKLYLALKIEDYNKNVYFQEDYSSIKAFEQVPFAVKIKSERGLKNAINLINILMQNNEISINEKYEKIDVILLLKDMLSSKTGAVQDQVLQLEESGITSFYGVLNNLIKKSFNQKCTELNQQTQEYFEKIHNDICAYKNVHYRLSFKGVSYRIGRKLLAKIVVRGKTLKLHLALDVNSFNKKVYFQQDYSSLKAFEHVPFAVKIKSNRGLSNAIKLVEELMKQNNIIKNDKYLPVLMVDILKKK